jgi:hypothetical protein
MSIYTVEIDGKQYDIEGNREPTEQEARQAVAELGGNGTTTVAAPQEQSLSNHDRMLAAGIEGKDPSQVSAGDFTRVTGSSPQAEAARAGRMTTSFATPEGDQALAAMMSKTPFAARIGSLTSGIPVETVKQGLKDYANVPDKTMGEKLAGAVGGAAGQMTGFLPAAAATGGLAGAMGAGTALENAIALLGGSAIQAGGAALANKEPILKSVTQAEIGTLLGMGAGKIGAQFVPKQIPGAERIGSTLGGFGLGYALPAATPEDRLVSALAAGGQMAAFPMKRNVLDPQQQILSIKEAVHTGMNKLKIGAPARLTSAAEKAAYSEKTSSAILDLYKNKDNLTYTDANGNQVQGLPKDPYQVLEGIAQLKQRKIAQMKDLESKATVDPITGQAMGRAKFLIPVEKIMATFNGMLGDKDVQTALKYDEAMPKQIIKLKAKLNQQGSLAMDDVDSFLKFANSYWKSYDPSMPQGAKSAWALMANAIRSTSEKFLDSFSSGAGKDWRSVRREYGALSELETSMSKVATKYSQVNPEKAGVVDMLSNLSVGEIARGLIKGSPVDLAIGGASKILTNMLSKRSADAGKVISNMFGKIDHHTNLKTLNDIISAEYGAKMGSQAGFARVGKEQPKIIQVKDKLTGELGYTWDLPNSLNLPEITFAKGMNPERSREVFSIKEEALKSFNKWDKFQNTLKGETTMWPDKSGVAPMAVVASLGTVAGKVQQTKQLPYQQRLADLENYGKTTGNWAHITQTAIDQLVKNGTMPKGTTIEAVRKDPGLYNKAVSQYWNHIGKAYNIPESERALWWRAPSWYQRTGGNVEKLPEGELKQIMRSRVKNGKQPK